LEVLQNHIDKMEYCVARERAHEWFIHHVAFHEGIYRGSGNGRLMTLISTVSLSIQRFHPLLLTVPGRLRDALVEHKNVCKALEARDCDSAERMARLHIANAKEIVIKTIRVGQESYAELMK
jgi:DNA-binding GntR family transcriptional regulator